MPISTIRLQSYGKLQAYDAKLLIYHYMDALLTVIGVFPHLLYACPATNVQINERRHFGCSYVGRLSYLILVRSAKVLKVRVGTWHDNLVG